MTDPQPKQLSTGEPMPDIEPSIIPDSLAGIYARYRSIAPDPDPESPDVTAQLARHLAVTGLRRMALAQAKFSPRDVEAACTAMAAVRLLVRLELAGDATPIARHIAVAWADGGEVEEWLHASALSVSVSTRLTTPRPEGRGFRGSRPGVPVSRPTAPGGTRNG